MQQPRPDPRGLMPRGQMRPLLSNRSRPRRAGSRRRRPIYGRHKPPPSRSQPFAPARNLPKPRSNKRKRNLTQAKLNLQYTTITAPVNGVVTNRTVEAGQNVQPGQELMRIINLDDIWVTANFKETQLRHMRVNQPVTIHVDTTGQGLQRPFAKFCRSQRLDYQFACLRRMRPETSSKSSSAFR